MMHEIVTIEGDELVIRLNRQTLTTATEHCPSLIRYMEEEAHFSEVRVTDHAAWLKEVAAELRREAEDGTTLVHLMFDKAFFRAAENGADGIECT
jgi:hypothetical protein